MDVQHLTIQDISQLYADGGATPGDIVEAYKQRAEKHAGIHAYLELFNTSVDNDTSDGTLAGVPLAIKDNILIEGHIASAASRMLEEYRAPYDATVIKKLKKEKAVFIGRTNMDEFAMGSTTENSAFGATKNPIDTSRVPGGSSGGSAAAVAAGLAPAALGSDTGGSIRQPASFCGLVGLKPTYGAVSRSGLIAMGSSLDQIGPITKTVEDTQILFNVIKGQDPLDSTTLPESAFQIDTKDTYTIGVPWHLVEQEGIDDDVVAHFRETIESLKASGVNVVDIELPHVKYALAAYYIVMPAEVSSNLARFDGVKYGLHIEGKDLLDEYLRTRGEGFGDEVRRRILLGTYVLSSGYYDAYYRKAAQARDVLREEFVRAFKEVDMIATPTTPSPAFKIGEKIDDPLSMYLSDIFTVPANITGVPAISIPSGTVERDGSDLPLGLQLMAPDGAEDMLFDLGKHVESTL